MGIQPQIRAAVNVRYDDALVRVCKTFFEVSSYDRMKEPARVKSKEGATVNWGTRQALAKNPKAEVIYHSGDIGKEPMINIFGRTPREVV
jgi:hydroxymethylpyrimidine/phosphomethylpyrimidine kinase